MKKLFFILFFTNLAFAMAIEPEAKKIPLTEFKHWKDLPSDLRCNVIDFSAPFSDVHLNANDYSLYFNVEEVIKTKIIELFKIRTDLALINKDIYNLIMVRCKNKFLKAIGEKLSEEFNRAINTRWNLENKILSALMKLIIYFSNNKDVIKALSYVTLGTDKTPLVNYTIQWGNDNLDELKILLSSGIDINLQNKNLTALHRAAWSSKPNAVKILLAAGANINAQDINRTTLTGIKWGNNTPLHFAIGQTEAAFEAVKTLVEAGANVNTKNYEGKTPLDSARIEKNERIEKYLIEHGAKSGEDLP